MTITLVRYLITNKLILPCVVSCTSSRGSVSVAVPVKIVLESNFLTFYLKYKTVTNYIPVIILNDMNNKHSWHRQPPLFLYISYHDL